MKKVYFLMFQLIGTLTLFGQVNPENIILKQSKNGSIKVIYKNELSNNLDSININLLNKVRHKLFIKQDSIKITELLIGKWSFQNTVRSNGKEVKNYVAPTIKLNEDGTFTQIYQSDTAHGKWSYQKTEIGNLKLKYNKPQTKIKDKNILEYLDEKTIKSMTYSSNIMAINYIDDKYLKFFETILIDNSVNTGETHYRVFFINYKKEN